MGYSAPAGMTELDATLLAQWNDRLSEIFSRQIQLARQERVPPGERAWLFDPIAAGGGPFAEASISWTAFPKRIASEAPTPAKAWQRADENRNNQEEYCEWEVVRDPAGGNKVKRVTFSCETQDYYGFLAERAPELLLELYRRHLSPNVQLADLVVNGEYQPQNRWNYPQIAGARGILMHMGQVNNSFEAAVNLTAVASWPRVDGNRQPITGEQALIGCRPFGDARRHSDPHIGAEINALVRAGNEISFADPTGLYIDSIDQSDWETPDGSPPETWFRIVRGTPEFTLRVVFEAPAGSSELLGDVRIGGRPVQFGGQIAEKLRVRIRGIARPASAPAPRLTCGGSAASAGNEALIAARTTFLQSTPTRLPAGLNVLSPE